MSIRDLRIDTQRPRNVLESGGRRAGFPARSTRGSKIDVLATRPRRSTRGLNSASRATRISRAAWIERGGPGRGGERRWSGSGVGGGGGRLGECAAMHPAVTDECGDGDDDGDDRDADPLIDEQGGGTGEGTDEDEDDG